MVAWDEYSVDENVEGFEEACSTELSKISDVQTSRIVDIEVDEKRLISLMQTPTLKGEIS